MSVHHSSFTLQTDYMSSNHINTVHEPTQQGSPYTDKVIQCQRLSDHRKYTQDQSESCIDIYLFIFSYHLLYITVVCMLPHTFLALLLKIREGVVRGKSYYNYDTYFSTMSHVRTVTTSINL